MALRQDGNTLLLECHIQPRASRNEWAGPLGDAVKIRITAPPVDGEANACLVRFLADAFGVPQKQVTIVRGQQGRRKTVRIEAPRRYPPEIPAA